MSDKKRIEELNNFLLKDPNDSNSRFSLAIEIASDGNLDEAVHELRELISRDVNYLAAYHKLGKILVQLNKSQEAKNILRTGIDIATRQNNLLEKNDLIEELEELEDEW